MSGIVRHFRNQFAVPLKSFELLSLDQLIGSGTNGPAIEWLWEGYLARGGLTLLTSLWKAGKTTLLHGLLKRLEAGGDFLGRACNPARTLVVSEESPIHWASRLRKMPLGLHARLLSRPFLTRPTPAEWNELVEHARDLRAAGELDLFAVDPLVSFLPGRSESDPGTLLEMLQPLQRLAATGVAVLVLHHPRKKPSEEGSSARGGGALLGFVDIILELHRVGGLHSDERRRRLVGLSRHAETPRQLVYQWEATGEFVRIDDPFGDRFRDNWEQVRAILAGRTTSATHHELLNDWPPDRPKPSPSVLYEWLNRATEQKLVRRAGTGRRSDPYRYRLPNQDDEVLGPGSCRR